MDYQQQSKENKAKASQNNLVFSARGADKDYHGEMKAKSEALKKKMEIPRPKTHVTVLPPRPRNYKGSISQADDNQIT